VELHDYLGILRKRRLSIFMVTALAVAGAAIWTITATPTYRADSQVFISVSTGGNTSDLVQGSAFTQSRVKSYTDLATRPRVLLPVINQLRLATSPDELAQSITAENPLDTVLINISVTDTNPARAADVANAVAESLGAQVTLLEKPVGRQESSVNVSSTQAATAPTSPASPNTKIDLALGLLLGLGLGIALALVQEALDTKVRTEADVQKITDASVIARIPYDAEAPAHPLIVQSSPHGHRSEAFRRLRTNLQFLEFADRPRTIVVTSSLTGEGKTTTAINLAITLADAGARVALVDADLRRPSVADHMGLAGEVGLTTVLIGQVDVQDAIQPWGNGNLHVLPSGQIPPNPSELLGSRSMAKLLETLASQYDMVLIDTPPLLPVTDAVILAKNTGGALVVAGADMVHRQQLTDGLGSLRDVGARVFGVILNRIPGKRTSATSYESAPAAAARAAQESDLVVEEPANS
jgi:capsular exopolysaccharide synthesis family protein